MRASLSLLLAQFISVVNGKTVFSIRDTWPYSDNVADACYPDPCNLQGFCQTYNHGLNYTCTCINGYTGDTCAEEKPACDDSRCENGGTCFWIFDEEACSCRSGYTGSMCEEYDEELYNPCLFLTCGGEEQGTCVDNNGVGECVCEDGWEGDYCTHAKSYCTSIQYMNLVQQLLLIQPQYQLSCTYLVTQIWPMVPDGDVYPALCECLAAMQEFIPDAFNGLDCVIDHGLTLTRAVEEYCPLSCTEDYIDDMLYNVSLLDDNCHHFIYDRATMPQYRRDIYKCKCLTSLASTYEEALELFPCPFAMHSAANGAIAWQNCYDEVVCDFQGMYTVIEDVMFPIDAIASEFCMYSISTLAEILPTGPGAYELEDVICPCLRGLNMYWPEGLSIFDCHPVVFFEVTLMEIMQLVCTETQFKNTDCTYNLTSSVFELSKTDFSGATNCFQAMKLGDQIMETNTNFDEIFCNCYSRLNTIDSFNADAMDECAMDIEWIVPTPSLYCDNYFGNSLKNDLTEDETYTTSDDSEETLWITLGIIFSFLLAGIISFNIWILCTTNSAVYKQHNGEEPTQRGA